MMALNRLGISQLMEQSAPQSCKNLSIIEALDADEHAGNLTNWQQQYDQISAGAFYGNIIERTFTGLQIFKEQTNQALQQRCRLRPEALWLGIPARPQTGCRINGLLAEADTLLCCQGGREFELGTPPDYAIFGIVVSQPMLDNYAMKLGVTLDGNGEPLDQQLLLPVRSLANIRFLLSRLLSNNHLASLMPDHLQFDQVMRMLLETLEKKACYRPYRSGYQQRKKVVDTVKGYLAENHDSPITITDLCTIANVSRRTLQYSFNSITGISPLKFLRISRLNGVRRTLYQNTEQQSIADIAAQWGFWHPGLFSRYYRELFGRLPSETGLEH